MLDRLSRGRRNLALLLLAAGVLWFAWSIRGVLNPLILGYFFAFILHPFVAKLQQRGFSRRNAVNTIYTLGLIVLAGTGFAIVLQVRELAIDITEGIDPQRDIQPRLDSFTAWLNGTLGLQIEGLSAVDPSTFKDYAKTFLSQYGDEVRVASGASLQAAGGAVDFMVRFVGRLIGLGGLFVMVPLYAYYLLFELERLHGYVARYVPKAERGRISRVSLKIGEVIANFFRGRLGVCFLKGSLLSLGLLIADVDYAFLFGMTSGFLSLVPFVGPLIGFVGAASLGIIEHGVIGSLWRTGLVFGVGELLEGYVLIPKVLGDTLGLHPVVVLFSMLAGGAAFGMLGILVALPLTASIVILFQEFVSPVLGQWAEED